MSAIWGYLSFHNSISADAGIRMLEPYKSKCKLDRIHTLTEPQLLMGCGIQHITKESERETLPLHDAEENFFFNADCILDNRDELLSELHLSDSSLPDGTLMYLAYKKWHLECLKHFRGLFSLAIYHPAKQVLYLAADQVASRCLYYYSTGSEVAFSTLIAPIRAIYPDIARNEDYIRDFLTAPGLMPNISSNETPHQNIFLLNPGCYMTITPSGVTETSYWTPAESLKDCHCHSANSYGHYFRMLYEQCVQDAIRTSGEVGIAMSSGLDSASVGALAATELAKTSRTLYSYTYIPAIDGMTDRNRDHVLNEEQDVRQILKAYPNIQPQFLNNDGKNCLEDLEHILDIMEIPFKACVNLPNLCEIYRNAHAAGCRVVLSGQTGNSNVSHGYIDDVLYDLVRHKDYGRFLLWLNRYSKTVKESRKQAFKGCLRYFRHADNVYQSSEFRYTPDNPFLKPEAFSDYPLKTRYCQHGVTLFDRVPTPSDTYQLLLYRYSQYTYLGTLETKLGLAHGILLRDPTKDIRILQFCYHLPYRYFAYKGTPRWLIRGNLQDLLPASLLSQWMRYAVQNIDWHARLLRDWNTLQPKLEELLTTGPMTGYIQTEQIVSLLHDFPSMPLEQSEQSLQYLLYLIAASTYCFLDNRQK